MTFGHLYDLHFGSVNNFYSTTEDRRRRDQNP